MLYPHGDFKTRFAFRLGSPLLASFLGAFLSLSVVGNFLAADETSAGNQSKRANILWIITDGRQRWRRSDEKLDILRAYTRDQTTLIIGGRSPQPAGKTLDGHIADAFPDHMRTAGATAEKPLFVNLGFHFPHSPVLPPQKFRDLFADKSYAVPDFDRNELNKLPPQLVTLHQKMQIDGLEWSGQLQEGNHQKAAKD